MNFIKKNLYKIIVTIVAIIFIILFFYSCGRESRALEVANKKLAVATQNIAALQDTIRLTKTKDNKPEFDKLAFLTDKVENLEKLNVDLARTVKNINGKVSSIIKSSVSVTRDSFPVVVKAEMVDSTITATFDHDTTYSPGNYRKLSGFTQYNLRNGNTNAMVTKDKIGMTFTTGIKNFKEGKPEIFVTSDYPGFKVDSLAGAVLNPDLFKPKPRQKLLTLGFNIGYTPVTYSFIKQKFDVDIGRIGFSIGGNINLTRLLKR